MTYRLLHVTAVAVLCMVASAQLYAQPYSQSWRGFVAAEYRLFSASPLDTRQHDTYSSIALQPEFYTEWDDGHQAITITPFYRWDQYDMQRRHADLRELFWLYVGRNVEWRVGWRKVFWGVTESQHLVDIINQTDFVEDLDGEEKFGQPVVSMNVLTQAGAVELFLLPGFRERSFAGAEGRPRMQPRVDVDGSALYEDSDRDEHIDWAMRWTQTLGYWDIGLSHFSGTGREPLFSTPPMGGGETILQPYYQLIEQTGLDVQATLNSWLWKLEAIRRSSEAELYGAVTAGLEYTAYGVLGTAFDIGGVMEYLYDSRGAQAPTASENDVMFGLRLSPNDLAGTEMLVGMIMDNDSAARVYSIEASRRLSDHLRLDLQGRFFAGLDADEPLYSLRNDNLVELELSYYF